MEAKAKGETLKMKIAYFDCFSGISGDMIIGALIDAGLKVGELKEELLKLDLAGYKITSKRSKRKGIAGTRFIVQTTEKHEKRNLYEILDLIDNSRLEDKIKRDGKVIFKKLAEAEARIHGTEIEDVHFHEIGAVDSIIDIVGALIGLESMGIERIFASNIRVGRGTLTCSHGTLPVPPPATVELLKGVPVYSTGIEGELVTPTGAAIITTLCHRFGHLPSMVIEKTGYGLGSRNYSIPNVLRVIIGERSDRIDEDAVRVIETNIDDMNPQFYDYIIDKLFEAGARDVFLTPVIMKKNRPGIILTIISPPEKTDELTGIVFRQTTTFGVRISDLKMRKILSRKIEKVKSRWGDVKVKIGFFNESQRYVAPEYEECKRIAKRHGIPIRTIHDEIKRIAEEKIFKKNKD